MQSQCGSSTTGTEVVRTTNVCTNKRRGRTWFLPYLLLSFAGLTACAQVSSPPIVLPGASVSAADEASAKQLTSEFVADVTNKNYKSAEELIALSSSKDLKLSKLRESFNSGVYQPLRGSTDWQYLSFSTNRHEKQIIVHCQFRGGDGISYHTNVIDQISSGKLLVASILPPSKPRVLIINGKAQAQ